MLVHHFLERSAAANPDKIALVHGGEHITYAALEERAGRLCEALCELGLQPRDRAVLHLENSIETLLAVFAVLKAGAIFALLNPQLKERKLTAILEDCAAACVLTDSALGIECADRAASVRFAVRKGDAEARMSRLERLHALRSLHAARTQRTVRARQIREVDVCALIYTSGSTGVPKGVTVTHRNVHAAASSILEYLDIRPMDRVLNVLPLASDYGLYNVLMPLRRGATVILDRPYQQPSQIVGPLNQEKVTGLPLTPTVVAMLRRFRHLGIRHPDAVRWITSTGQALTPAHSRWLRSAFPAARVYSMYGLSECKRVSFLPPEELDRRPASVGKAIPKTEAFIVDSEGRRIERAGEIGELIVRGQHVMQGYWNRPRETAEVLVKDAEGEGFLLRTGDFFKMDGDGFLYFVGRQDRLIKSGGHRVSPREVEDVIGELEDVCEAAAWGVPHDVLGEAIHLAVVVQDGSPLTVAQIRAHCEAHLEKYRVPRDVEILPSLPRTAAGKVDYRSMMAVRVR